MVDMVIFTAADQRFFAPLRVDNASSTSLTLQPFNLFTVRDSKFALFPMAK
jgi:hypothetical protein